MNRLRAFAVSVALAAACSSYGSQEDDVAPPPDRDAGTESSTANDGGNPTDADPAVDAVDGGPTKCDRTVPFGLPAAIPGLANLDYEGSPRLTADELHIFWSRYANGQWALWTASRQNATDPFSGSLMLANVNDADAGRDLDPSPTSDGLTLYFTSERLGTADIFSATRGATTAAFPQARKVDPASGSNSDRRPFISADGKSLWFDSDRSGASRIYRVEVSPLGVGNPAMIDLGAASTSVHDEYAVLSHDGLALYIAGIGRGDGTHVYMATRANAGAAFGPPARIDTSTGFAAPGWISADECRLYLAIGGQTGGTRLAMAKRAK